MSVGLAYGALAARSADSTQMSVLALYGFDSLRGVRAWMQSLGVYDGAVYRQAAGYIASEAQALIDTGRVR